MSDTPDLKAVRARLRLNQTEMAERLGIDRTSIVHMESGRRSPRGSTLKLLRVLALEAEKMPPVEPNAEVAA